MHVPAWMGAWRRLGSLRRGIPQGGAGWPAAVFIRLAACARCRLLLRMEQHLAWLGWSRRLRCIGQPGRTRLQRGASTMTLS